MDIVEDELENRGAKFSSECLELLLERNFIDAAEYLIENYYPSTQIDTEVIIKAHAEKTKWKQYYIMYLLYVKKHQIEEDNKIANGELTEEKRT